MANKKKTQTSTGKKRTTQKKNEQIKVEKNKKEESKQMTKVFVAENETVNQKDTKRQKQQVKKTIEAKKKKTNNKEKSEKVGTLAVVGSDEMGKLGKIIFVLIIIVIVFYGLTVLITKVQKNSVPERNKNTTPAVIQYDEILIGTMLNQKRDEYYVLIQKDDDQYRTLTSYYLQKYSSNSKALKVYMANMNSIYNQFYISETSNIKTNNMNEFRVSAVTLVKIKNHEIIEAYEGLEEVEKAFKALISQK